MFKTTTVLAAAALLTAAAAAQAQGEVPLLTPQWSKSFGVQMRSSETALEPLHGSWIRLGDGSYLIGSRDLPDGNGLRLRALAADGSDRYTRLLPAAGGQRMQMQLTAIAADGGAYLLYGADSDWMLPTLERLDAAGTRQWQATLPEGGANGSGRLRQLVTLSDSSALVVQQRMFSRITASGGTQWTLRNGDDHQYLLRNGGAVRGADGNLWLAGGGGSRSDPDGARVAAVRRMDDSGRLLTLHTFLCASCSESAATAIAALPDGEVAVVGRSGDNEPGFIAFYHSNGAPRLRVDTPPGVGYDRLVHDANGNLYAYSERDERVTALNRDGSVRWQRDGGDLSALAHGVLISSRFPRRAGALRVEAVDADGQLRWSQTIEASDGLRAGGAVVAADGRIGLLAQINRSEDGCGVAPRVITLDAYGTPLDAVRACTTNQQARLLDSTAAAGAGAVVLLQDRLIQLSPDAQTRSQHPACPLCLNNDRYPLRARLNGDGTLWMTQTRTSPLSSGGLRQRFIVRLGVAGIPVDEVEIPALGGADFRTLLLADAQRAIELSPQSYGLLWTRVGVGDVQPLLQQLVLPGSFDTVAVSNSRLWPDGSISLAVWRANLRGCQTSPPSPIACTPRLYTVLRLNADGSERWRAELGESWGYSGFNDDGSVLAFWYPRYVDERLRYRRIGSDGSIGAAADFPVASTYPGTPAGPVQGKYLLALDSNLHLLDGAGNVLQTRPGDDVTCCHALAYGSRGFLVSARTHDATLLSADDLSSLARLDFDGVANDDYAYPPLPQWQLLDDGSIYATVVYPPYPSNRPRLARFAVPDSAAADRLFLDRFD